MRRFWPAVGTLAALTIVAINGAWLIAEAYASVAVRAQIENPKSRLALEANRIAANLAPWLAETRGNAAWLAAASDLAGPSAQDFAALRWSPADPYLWSMQASLLARQLQFGRANEIAVARANALGPRSVNIQMQNALIGLHFWFWGSETLQGEWLSSMRFALQHERKRFLGYIMRSDRGPVFCGVAAQPLGAEGWCRWYFQAVDSCAQARPSRRLHRRCESLGLLP